MLVKLQQSKYIWKIITIGIASVWLVNGLLFKILSYAPRHELIVSGILGEEHADFITKLIGTLEILMALWILSGIKSRWCAVTQILVVATMNIIELILVPDLLLFGRFNLLWATCFMTIVFITEFRRFVFTSSPNTKS